MKHLLALLLCCAVVGCATPKSPVAAGTPSLYLADTCDRLMTRGPDAKVTIPAGLYTPVFQDAGGIFYRGEAEMISGSGQPFHGYLVYVMHDGSCAVAASGSTIPSPLDHPVPFTSAK